MSEESAPLPGGNTAPVVRVGDTVRRVAGPWTPQVRRLMQGLRAAGLTTVPEHLGLDDAGREVVEFVEGDVPVYPLPGWCWSDEVLLDVGRALRSVHNASAGLGLSRQGWRREAVEPVEVVCHGDVAPYNAVFRSGRLVAFIDWDYAGPGPRLWDLGYAAYRFVSLTPPGHRDGQPVRQSDAEQWRRVALLCAAYGDVEPREVVRWAARRLADLVDYSRARAAAGDPAFLATIAAGHVELYEGDLVHVQRLLDAARPATGRPWPTT